MLQNNRDFKLGLAWWCDSREARLSTISGRAAAPASTGCSFFAPDFALVAGEPWFHGQPAEPPRDREPLPMLMTQDEPSRAEFAKLHAEVMERIAAREFAKVVPVVCEQLHFAAPLRAAMFTGPHDADLTNGQIAYGFEFAGEGLCGVTPELLFHVQGETLTTMALAGTGLADGPSLRDDRKECHEHQLVIEHIVSELKAWGMVDVGTTNERTYGRLKHLHTPITVRLGRRADFSALVRQLHPTAALGGWPRSAAVTWLEKQNFHQWRRRFGAPFGFVDGEQMACAVAIRGVQWQGADALLAAGCGIVAGSDCAREWNELYLKRQATRRNLGLGS